MRLQPRWQIRVLLGASLCVHISCAAPAPTETSGGGVSNPPPPEVGLQAKSSDAFVQSIGVNVHLSYFRTVYGSGWSTIVKPRLIELGVRHVRDAGSVVTSDSWMQTVYGRMNELAAAKVKFNLILKPAEGSTDYTKADHLDRLMRYAAGAVESFEGLNEHDLSGHANWVTEVRAFQQAIHRKLKGTPSTANLPLFGPSMGHAVNASQVGDLSGYMNYGAVHPYPGGLRPLTNVEAHVTAGRTINGSRPLVATETGYHTALLWAGGHPHVAEDAEARYVPRLYLDYFKAGFARTFLYELIDEGSSDTLREERFGLVRADGTPKPAYTSLRNLITVLADPGPAFTPGKLDYALSGDTTNVRQLLLQKRDGRFYLVLWHDAVSFDLQTNATAPATAKALTLTLGTPASLIRATPVLQSAQPAREWTTTAEVALVVPDSPLVIEVTR